ncbi:bifunctional UDP-2,4-diacetamido-2,4,6-trideoxy-beta-L-altropyranose hydrolase/GNAT family N-acetyltransferase [Microbacterium sp. ProA8]|uniref:bifunctional UDP-2,4-diacetamido-2,4,6-trideoxy-beta-L-altropyranose hydrolase/GNAT family N-acetyltransferase n=1 Tax=Microbacterium chionoecetis TaxID=3153754 RepID=UPI00326538A6
MLPEVEGSSVNPRTTLIHCNGGGDYGMGHCMRALALAEEAIGRGWQVHIAGDLAPNAVDLLNGAIPTARVSRIALRGVEEELLQLLEAESPDVVHLDTYWGTFDALFGRKWLLSNMQDGPFGVRDADVSVDANLGAEAAFVQPAAHLVHLAGSRAALTRRAVRRHHHEVRQLSASAPRAVTVVLGGTDPGGVTPLVVEALSVVECDIELTVVSPSGDPAVVEAARRSPHAVRVVPFVEDLPGLAVAQDLVISAAGTSVLDFASMGVPMAIVCVADNQVAGYKRAIAQGVALPLGTPLADDLHESIRALGPLLQNAAELRRLSDLGRASVDGLGAWRVVSAWESVLQHRPAELPLRDRWASRRASLADARLLFEWKNDEETRRRSRSTEPVSWSPHLEWLTRTVESSERRLLIVEHEGQAVGTVRWDHIGPARWEVSITVAPHARGKGIARYILATAELSANEWAPVTLVAVINEENFASLRLFASAGYLPDLPADEAGFRAFAKQLA